MLCAGNPYSQLKRDELWRILKEFFRPHVMAHLFCSNPSQANSVMKNIISAYELSPVSSVCLVSEAISKCNQCFSTYKLLDINSSNFRKEVMLYNFKLKMIYDWRVLLDKEIRSVFLSKYDCSEFYRGFKGFFAVVYGDKVDLDLVPELDLEDVIFGKDELNFFIELGDAFTNSEKKSSHNTATLDSTRYLFAFNIYISNFNTKLSRKFIPILQKMFSIGIDMTGITQSKYFQQLFLCVIGLFKRDRAYSWPFYPMFRELITSGLLFSLNLTENLDLLRIIREIQLLQLLLNRINNTSHRRTYQFIAENIGNLNIVEFAMENKLADPVVFAILKEMKEPTNAAGYPVSLFIKKLVYVKLRWLQYAENRLKILTTFDLCKEFGDSAYSLYYLKIFLDISFPSSSVGKLNLMSILSGIRGVEGPVIYSEEDILEIIDDIKEIGSYGHDTTGVTGLLIKNFKFSCGLATHFYKSFGFIEDSSIIIDNDIEALLQLIVKNGEYFYLPVLYKRAVILRTEKRLIMLLREYIEKYVQTNSVEKKPARMKMKCISINSKDTSETFRSNNSINLESKEQKSPRSRTFTILSSDESSSLTNIGKENSTSTEEFGQQLANKLQSSQASSVEPSRVVTNTGVSIEKGVDDKFASANKNDSKLGRSKGEHLLETEDKSNKKGTGKQVSFVSTPVGQAMAGKREEADSDDVVVIKNHIEENKNEPDSGKSCDNEEFQKYSIIKDVTRLKQIAEAAMNVAYERTSIMLEDTSILTKTGFISCKRTENISTPDTKTAAGKFFNNSTEIQGRTPSNKLSDRNVVRKEGQELDNKSFFDLLLSLYDNLAPLVKNIPASFSNYTEYFNTFNNLQFHDIRTYLGASIFNAVVGGVCSINKVDKPVEILVDETSISEYDLLLFTRCSKLTRAKLSEIVSTFGSRKKHACDNDCFIGFVERIEYKRGNKMSNSSIAHIAVSSKGIAALAGETYHYRIIQSMSTLFREYNALQSLRSSSLFGSILNPSEDLPQASPILTNSHERVKRWKDGANIEGSKLTNYVTCDNSSYNRPCLPITEFSLNDAQRSAVERCFKSSNRFVLIQGPPGTGKTRVILSIILALLQRYPERKILVCAPSNTAIDEIVMRMSVSESVNYFFVRIGPTTNQALEKYTLDYKASQECTSKGTIGLNTERSKILNRTSVVCSTLSSCVASYTTGIKFEYLIVDEACQATEPSTLIPMKYNFSKVILVGDPKQLPPTTFAKNSPLGYSLFERLSKSYHPLFLNSQYRMHPSICRISSHLFYDNKLITAPVMQSKIACKKAACKYKLLPVNFIHTTCGGEKVDEYRSYYNIVEAKAAIEICKAIESKYGSGLSAVVLTPYKAQANLLRSIGGHCYESNTIDGFQGKEADVVILSTVRETGLGFVCDFRRINVAITRARYGLIILGNYSCLRGNEIWKEIINSREGKRRYSTKELNLFLEKL
ncbi:hypothetical protein PAEPH01_1176 [Pancytospora epiphaga]|nr:hypothetical protein PAEPH01_1176 [Pancytospora epiphaga]